MKCRICGSETDKRNRWCPECGAELNKPRRRHDNDKRDGKKTVMICLAVFLCALTAVAGFVFFRQSKKDEIGAVYFKEIDSAHIAATESGLQYTDNEILVVAKEGTRKKRIERLAEKYNARIVGEIEKTGDYQWELIGTYTLEELEVIQADLENEKIVESASVNYIMTIGEERVDYDVDYGDAWREDMNDSDSIAGKSWGAEAINAPAAWLYLNQHKDAVNPIRIGLIDSGFDTAHEDLGFAETFYNSSADSHGTHVAGTMAAKADNAEGICGIYPYGDGNLYGASWRGAQLYDENKISVMAEKCNYAELILRNVKVINCSYAYKDFNLYVDYWNEEQLKEQVKQKIQNDADILADFLDRCLKEGYDFVIVTAAGNHSNQKYVLAPGIKTVEALEIETDWVDARYASKMNAISESYPEVYNRIIVVGSVGQEYNISSFSNTGDRVDIYAPGEKIYSTTPDNTYQNYYEQEKCDWSGTSMAAPHVSGTVAMVWSVNNHLTGAEVKAIICKSINGRSRDGYPMIDANLAVQYACDTDDGNQPVPEPLNGAALCYVVNIDNENVKVVGATITAVSKSDGRIEEATTDENGHFELILSEGEYTFTVTHPDYMDYVIDVTVKNEGVNYLDDWIKMERKDKETIRAKYDEVLKEVDENGILEECKEHFMCWDWKKGEGEYDVNIWGNPEYDEFLTDYPRYSPEESNFNFSVYDIDGDGIEELLIDWYDWYNWESYGEAFVDILQYHPETDTLALEGTIPTNRRFKEYPYRTEDSYTYMPLFFDNGVIITCLPWVNQGMGSYARQLCYDADSDTYMYADISQPADWKNSWSSATTNPVNVWVKVEYPEWEQYANTDGEPYIVTSPFPDELDLDGDGRLYCKFESEEEASQWRWGSLDCDISQLQWKDITEIEEFDIPEGEDHELNIEWYQVHPYVQNGERISSKSSISSVYGNIISDYYSVQCNDVDKDNIFYALSDLNYDGTDELIVGIASVIEDTNTVFYDKISIYTFQNGQAFLVAYDNNILKNTYHICENVIWHTVNEGTGTCGYVFYHLPENATKLEPKETVYYESYEPLDAPVTHYYHNYGGWGSEEAKEITEEEYNNIFNSYQEKQLELHYLTPELAWDLWEHGVQ